MPEESKQLRILYREFLFRLVDLELLPNPGDMVNLLGQLAALLMAFNLMFASSVRRVLGMNASTEIKLMASRGELHFFIATTMVAVGLFTVLCWDSTFPGRRDVLVLAPLPVRTRTIFLAKLGALLTALGLTVVCVNTFTGLSYPLLLGNLHGGGMGALRWLAAYWVTVLAAGGFILASVLAVQGVAAQVLPRRVFVRLSGFLQLASFVLLLGVYFLQPPLGLAAHYERLPSYWFLDLFLWLCGRPEALAGHALVGLGISIAGALTALALSYRHTMRKMVEEPEIAPGSLLTHLRLPRWVPTLTAAISLFSLRTLLRSRQHRLIYALYCGIGLAFALASARAVLYGQGKYLVRDPRGPLLVASILLLCCAVVGIRVVMTIPIEMGANWLFRTVSGAGDLRYGAAIRQAFLVLGVMPMLVVLLAVLVLFWPLRPVLLHGVVLVLWGWMLLEFCLKGFHKIPFTCSYLPGKANVHVLAGAGALVLVCITDIFVDVEKRALEQPAAYVKLLVFLAGVVFFARWRAARHNAVYGGGLQFDELPPREVQPLELHRDGRMAFE